MEKNTRSHEMNLLIWGVPELPYPLVGIAAYDYAKSQRDTFAALIADNAADDEELNPVWIACYRFHRDYLTAVHAEWEAKHEAINADPWAL